MNYPDEIIMQMISTGDYGAFKELYKRYSDVIYRNILVRVTSSFVADDIFQDFFVNLWEQREKIKIETNVRSYLLVWLRHHVLNSLKKEQIRDIYHENYHSQVEVIDNHVWEQILSDDMHEQLSKVVDRFPPRLKAVYILRREKNMSIKEISEALSISEQTVKNQMSEALKRLRKELESKSFIFIL